jgi:predicted DCC family thiol-disulfide oxidoreductase YuxK
MSGIILFDGICNLCNGIVQFIIRHDPEGKFKFASLQSEAGKALLQRAGLPENGLDTIVYFSEEHKYIRSAAALRILRDLGGFWKLVYVLIIIPAPIRDFVYNGIANSRYKVFGRREICMVPAPDLLQRFIV